MRTISPLIVLGMTIAGAAATAQAPKVDPERILSERFQFSTAEVGQARAGQPVVHVKAEGDEILGVGAIRLSGKKERLADWLKNVEHFRNAAELGVTHIVPAPPTAAGFAGVTLDAADLAELQQCAPEKCAIRLPANVLGQLQRDGVSKANDIIRQMLLDYTSGYIARGNAAVSPDLPGLIAKARTLTDLAPELVAYLDGYPKATLPAVDQVFYWSSMPAGSHAIVSVHHLIVYRRGPGEIWIADKNIYSSRYFDAAATVIGLYDAPDGTGFYAVAGSRMKVAQLESAAARLLRRQVERSAADTVKMYLEWIRDSLSQ